MAISSRASRAGGRLPPAPPGLPVWNTVRAAFSDVLANSDKVTRLALPWLLLSSGASVLAVAHPPWATLAWNAGQAMVGVGALAIAAAWVRWRLQSEEPRTMARVDRSVLCLFLRSLLHLLLVCVAAACVVVPWVVFRNIVDPTNDNQVTAVIVGALVAFLVYVVTFPLFYLYTLLGALRRDAPGLIEVLKASKGRRLRLWLVYVLYVLLSSLIPLVGIGVAMGFVGPVGHSLDSQVAGGTGPLVDGLITILGQAVSFGMAAASGALAVIVWSRLRSAQAP